MVSKFCDMFFLPSPKAGVNGHPPFVNPASQRGSWRVEFYYSCTMLGDDEACSVSGEEWQTFHACSGLMKHAEELAQQQQQEEGEEEQQGAQAPQATMRRLDHVRRCLAPAAAAAAAAAATASGGGGGGGTGGSVRARVSAAEWEQRVLLAAVYRMSASFGWDEYIYNHITAAVGSEEDGDEDGGGGGGRFLINPFGLRFREVTASSLVTLDLAGAVLEAGSSGRGTTNLAGFVIHSAVHASRRDIRCLFHNHTDACVAVASQRRGLLPLSQEACIIWPRVSPVRAYHDFEGVASDPSERGRLLAGLGPASAGRTVLFLRNHGVLVGGASVGGAFWNTYLVWRACQLQCAAMSAVGGRLDQLVMPSQDVVEGTGARVQAVLDGAGAEWGGLEMEAVLRQMRDEQPDFES